MWSATTCKGETPPPFDLLYWNSDATNLPGPLYAWYLRNTYLENKLRKPGEADGVRRVDRSAHHRYAGLHLRLARRPHRAARWRRMPSTQVLRRQGTFCDGRVRPHRRA
jgi:hypothetical protein